MDKNKLDKLRERGFFLTLIKNLQNSFSSFFGTIEKKVFRVRIENEKYMIAPLEKIALRLEKVMSGNQEYKQVGSVMVEGVSAMKVDGIQKIDIKELSQKDVTDKLEEIKKIVAEANNILSVLSKKEVKIPEYPKSVAISSPVGVSDLPPRLYTAIESLKASVKGVESQISNIKLEVPQQKEVVFPKEIEVSNLKELKSDLKELKTAIKEMPNRIKDVEFPESIAISNFPVQKIPQPVTHISINSLNGTIKTNAITLTTALSPLPATVLPFRRSVTVYNNSSSTIYVGGSDLTVANGLPIPAGTYSPAFDAGPQMILYGLTASGSSDIRVMEISDEDSGR